MDDKSDSRDLYMILQGVTIVVLVAIFIAVAPWRAPLLSKQQAQDCERYWQRDQKCEALLSAPTRTPVIDWLIDNLEFVAAGFTAAATFYIARFTRELKRSTDNLWTATKASADAVPAIERAYIFLKVEGDNLSECINCASGTSSTTYPTGDPVPYIKWRLHNGGRTTAIIVDIRMAILIQKIPNKPPFDNLPDQEYHDEFVHSANPTNENSAKLSSAIDEEQAKAICLPEGGKSIFFCGQIDYEDVLDKKRHTVFCLRWRPGKGGFEPYGGKEYNYRD